MLKTDEVETIETIETAHLSTSPTLYWANGSIPSWQVMFLLYEKEAEFISKRLKVMSRPKETKSPAFLKINPRGQTPTWVEPHGRVIIESMALLFYLNDRYPHTNLLPKTDQETYGRILQYCFEVESLRKAYRPLEQLFLGVDQLTPTQKEAIIKAPQAIYQELYIWERYASIHTFIASDELSLADCVIYPILSYQMRRGLSLEGAPHLKRYIEMISQREAAKRAYPQGWNRNKSKSLFKQAEQLALSL